MTYGTRISSAPSIACASEMDLLEAVVVKRGTATSPACVVCPPCSCSCSYSSASSGRLRSRLAISLFIPSFSILVCVTVARLQRGELYMRLLGFLPLAIIFPLAFVLVSLADAPSVPKPVAYKGARIHTAAGKPIDNGVLLVK